METPSFKSAVGLIILDVVVKVKVPETEFPAKKSAPPKVIRSEAAPSSMKNLNKGTPPTTALPEMLGV